MNGLRRTFQAWLHSTFFSMIIEPIVGRFWSQSFLSFLLFQSTIWSFYFIALPLRVLVCFPNFSLVVCTLPCLFLDKMERTFDTSLIHNDGLNNWIVSFAFGKCNLQFSLFNPIGNLWPLVVNITIFNLNFYKLFMGSIFKSSIFNNIHILDYSLTADFYSEYPLVFFLEIHLNNRSSYLCKFENKSMLSCFYGQWVDHLRVGMPLIHEYLFIHGKSNFNHFLLYLCITGCRVGMIINIYRVSLDKINILQ